MRWATCLKRTMGFGCMLAAGFTFFPASVGYAYVAVPGVRDNLYVYTSLELANSNFPSPHSSIDVGARFSWWVDSNGNEVFDAGESRVVEGPGVINHTNGTVDVQQRVRIGNFGYAGVYNLSGGVLNINPAPVDNVNGGLLIQGEGDFLVTQTGGELNTFEARLGTNPGSQYSSRYELEGGTANIRFLSLGHVADSTSYFDLSMGNLNVGQSRIGDLGYGIFNQYSGQHVTETLFVAVDGVAEYFQHDGDVFSYGSFVGYAGEGYYTQSGGLHEVTSLLEVGREAGSYGQYWLLGSGQLNVMVRETIGLHGQGVFYHEAGTHDVATDLVLAEHAGSVADYLMSGGRLSVGDDLDVGLSGAASFTQQGILTRVTVEDSLRIGRYSGGKGLYELTDGRLYIGHCSVCGFSHDLLELGTGGEGTFNQFGSGSEVHVDSELHLGVNGGSGTYNLVDGLLDVSRNEKIGDYFGTGEFNQFGGVNRVGNDLFVGQQGDGTYNLNNPAVVDVGDDLVVGRKARGVFNQYAGEVVVADSIYLGSYFNGEGYYNLSDGRLDSLREQIGDEGFGRFAQSAGVHAVLQDMSIGRQGSGEGEYYLYGGVLGIGGTLYLGDNGPDTVGRFYQSGGSLYTGDEQIGDEGQGVFRQVGGEHHVQGTLFVGEEATGVGSFIMEGGVLTASDVGIGHYGSGYFHQNGGDVDVSGYLVIGSYSSSIGEYRLDTGILSVDVEVIGSQGSGTFRQNGGDHQVRTQLVIAQWAGTTANYQQISGTLFAEEEVIGLGGRANFYQSGGVHSVLGDLWLGQDFGSDAYYELSATGDLSARRLIVGGAGSGRFLQLGGNNQVTHELIVGKISGGTMARYDLLGGNLDAYSEIIGDFGTGDFFQTDGDNRVQGDLWLGYESTADGFYSLSGNGSLTASREVIGSAGKGRMIQSGGSNLFDEMIIGQAVGSEGVYELQGGELLGGLSLGNVVVGDRGQAAIYQSGGHLLLPGTLTVGREVGSSGGFYLGAGTVDVSSVIVGARGVAEFFQTGGTQTVTGDLIVGEQQQGDGYYQIDQGELTAGNVLLGVSGIGSIRQRGGNVAVLGDLLLAVADTGMAAYTLEAGNLRSSRLFVGDRGEAEFLQTGGVNTVEEVFSLGREVNAVRGVYTLAGGSLDVFDAYLGDRGSASFVQNGGLHRVSGQFVIGNHLTGSGRYELNDGRLISVRQIVGMQGSAAFVQRGGKNIIAGELVLSRVLGGRSSYLLEDGELMAKNEFIGHSGEATFMQTGGINIIEDTLAVVRNGNLTGEYTLAGGELDVETIDTRGGGIFNFTGGVLKTRNVLGSLQNQAGVLAPGSSPGVATVSGDYTQGAAATLAIELGGLFAGSEYDQLIVGGIATLGGTLDVVAYDLGSGLFSPQINDVFDILIAETIIGQFDLLDLFAPGTGLHWELEYLLSDSSDDILRLRVAANAVPLPASLWLMMSGMFGLGLLRCRVAT